MSIATVSTENNCQPLPELEGILSYKEHIAKSGQRRKMAPRNRFDFGSITQLDRANGNSLLEQNLFHIQAGLANCQETYIIGVCEHEDQKHTYAKEILCNRDQCPTCGRRGSDAHRRRYGRIVPKVQQLSQIGYFTIQFLEKDRPNFRTKEALQKAGKAVKKVLKSLGFDRGLRRWDWFGEPKCPVCWRPMQWAQNDTEDDRDWECKHGHGRFSVDAVTPSTMKWHPHVNVLVEGRYLEKSALAEIQRELSLALVGAWDVELSPKGGIKKINSGVILHYEYAEDGEDAPKHAKFVRQALHWARYIEKPTFLGVSWDPEMAATLYNFRNGSWWGSWKDPKAWELETQEDSEDLGDLIALLECRCPVDGAPIRWEGKIMPASKLHGMILDAGGEMIPEGGGYYLILA